MSPQEVLKKYSKIAVVGMSPNPDRASHYVSEHMIEAGYDVVGVNPGQTEILGRPVYGKLSEVPGSLEIVNVFRASEYLMEVTQAAIERKAKVLWIQLDIADAEAEKMAEDAGLIVIRRKCIMVEHQAL